MGRVSTYLNFPGCTEEAFTFYAEVFGTTITSLQRFSSMPFIPVGPEESELVLNVQLPIYGGHLIMGSDMLASHGHQTRVGNNTTLVLDVDSREEADYFFAALSAGGDETQQNAMTDMPFGYWGTCLDRYGIRWMFNFSGDVAGN